MADAYYAVVTGVPGAPYVDLTTPAPSPWRAVRTTALCLAVGLASRLLYGLLTGAGTEPEAAVRYAFVTTLGVYVAVGALLGHAVRERLDWRATPLNAGIGLALGGGVAYVLLRGDLTTAGDPRIALLVSEGTLPNVAATVLIAVVAAPVCEEVLFRGLLLTSLADSLGRRLAVWVSGLAFAAWHLDLAAMPYYTLFGAVFGALYLRRGLLCSMAAHAAFNGLLVVSAVMYATGPGVTVRAEGLVVTAPPGWRSGPGPGLHLRGPSAAEILAISLPGGAEMRDPYDALDRLATADIDGVDTAAGKAVRLPVGDALRVPLAEEERDGEVVIFVARGRAYVVVLISGGSPRVRSDFGKMLRSVRLAS